jgi:hypothetical protein
MHAAVPCVDDQLWGPPLRNGLVATQLPNDAPVVTGSNVLHASLTLEDLGGASAAALVCALPQAAAFLDVATGALTPKRALLRGAR